MKKTDNGPEYLIEFITVGKSMKVTAFDPVTMKEVSMMGAPRVSRAELSRLAIRKLRYVIRRDSKKSE